LNFKNLNRGRVMKIFSEIVDDYCVFFLPENEKDRVKYIKIFSENQIIKGEFVTGSIISYEKENVFWSKKTIIDEWFNKKTIIDLDQLNVELAKYGLSFCENSLLAGLVTSTNAENIDFLHYFRTEIMIIRKYLNYYKRVHPGELYLDRTYDYQMPDMMKRFICSTLKAKGWILDDPVHGLPCWAKTKSDSCYRYHEISFAGSNYAFFGDFCGVKLSERMDFEECSYGGSKKPCHNHQPANIRRETRVLKIKEYPGSCYNQADAFLEAFADIKRRG
jgi:hypothetical protein